MNKLLLILPILMFVLLFGCTQGTDNKQIVEKKKVVDSQKTKNQSNAEKEEQIKNESNSVNETIANTTVEQNKRVDAKADFWKDYEPSSTCFIKTDNKNPRVGEEFQVRMWATVGQGQKVTYSCGDDKIFDLGTGGIREGARFYTLNNSGEYKLWIAVDGKPCNHLNLTVK